MGQRLLFALLCSALCASHIHAQPAQPVQPEQSFTSDELKGFIKKVHQLNPNEFIALQNQLAQCTNKQAVKSYIGKRLQHVQAQNVNNYLLSEAQNLTVQRLSTLYNVVSS